MSLLLHDPKLTALVARLPALSGITGIEVLGGGLTNKNYRMDCGNGVCCVMRVSDAAPGLLGINRQNEKINTQRAHEAGVGPAVIDALLQEGVLLIDWINAQTLHPSDMQGNTDLLKRMAVSLRLLHAAAFAGIFHFPSLRKKYAETVLANNYFVPEQYLELAPMIIALEDALAANPEELVSCNNDLLAENFMDDGNKIWIIDYEYAGMNEASFEIGNLVSESGLSTADITTICDAYWQQHLPEKIARVQAWSMIARYGWVMWASIQSAVSTIDFDFKTWGIQKWNSVLPDLKSDHYYSVLHILKQTHS